MYSELIMAPEQVSIQKPDGYMTDHRVRNLLEQEQALPPRTLDYGENDRFGLLGVEDTYESVVGMLFSGCEAMEEHFVGKRGRRKADVKLPEVRFDEARRFVIERSTHPDKSKQYFFQRVDNPSSGFILYRSPEGHILLRNPGQGDTSIGDNQEYAKLISQASNFLKEYAISLGMTAELLAPKEPKVKTAKKEHPLLDKLRPSSGKVAKFALVGSVYVGFPFYCVHSSMENGSRWEVANIRNDEEQIASDQAVVNKGNNQLLKLEQSVGSACAAALAPYSPDGNLGPVVSIADAASQLSRESRCNSSGENTQLLISQYQNDINNIDGDKQVLSNDEGGLSDEMSGKVPKEVLYDLGGVIVGGIGDLIFGLCYPEVLESLKRRKDAKTVVGQT